MNKVLIKEIIAESFGGIWGTEPEGSDTATKILRSTNITKDNKVTDLDNVARRHIPDNLINKYLLQKGDIIITKSSGSQNHIGKSILIDGTLSQNSYSFANFMQLLRVNKNKILPEYFFLYISSQTIREKILKESTTTTGLRNLKINAIMDLEIPLSSISEQKQIVSKIKKCFALLNESEEKLKQAEEKLNNVLDSSLLSLQNETGNVYPLNDLVTIQKQTTKLDENRSSFYIALEDIEVNTGRLLNKKYITGKQVKSTKLRFNTKHVLYSKLRPYLNKVIIPPEEGICVTDLLPLLPNQKVTQKYLYYYLRSPQIRNYINQRMAGIKMPRLRTKDLNNMPIFVPSIETQNNVVKKIERLTEEAYNSRTAIQNRMRELELLNQSILKKAFEGKLT